jgi:hypothetical protein
VSKTKKTKRKPTEREKIVDFIDFYAHDEKDNILLADGFENAFMGLMSHNGHTVAVYSRWDCILELQRKNDWTWTDSEEYFNFNVECAYVGDYTPVFMDRY